MLVSGVVKVDGLLRLKVWSHEVLPGGAYLAGTEAGQKG